MNKHRFGVMQEVSGGPPSAAACLIFICALQGCWDSSPCDPGQIVVLNQCRDVPSAADAAARGGSSTVDADDPSDPVNSGDSGDGADDAASERGAATGGRSAADSFSYKECTGDADCGGQTPTCTPSAPPPSTVRYCTLSPCSTGAGDTCPQGGTCTDRFAAYGAANFCVKNP